MEDGIVIRVAPPQDHVGAVKDTQQEIRSGIAGSRTAEGETRRAQKLLPVLQVQQLVTELDLVPATRPAYAVLGLKILTPEKGRRAAAEREIAADRRRN